MRRARLLASAGLVVLALAACLTDPGPDATPYPTTAPTAPPEAAATVTDAYLAAWKASDFPAMYALLAPADRVRYPLEHFVELHATFAQMTRTTGLEASAGTPRASSIEAQPRPPDFPPPSPTPDSTPDPSASPTIAPTPAPSFDVEAPLPGPIPAMVVPVELAFETDRFGALDLERSVTLTQGPEDWQVRWTPALLFPELAGDGHLELTRTLGPRGRILTADGSVFAETRDDGMRVYPQESLAGQTIGYVSEVTAEEMAELEIQGYQAGDVIGRSGLELGAEALLRGSPGFTLSAVPAEGAPVTIRERQMVPGAVLTITLRPELQAAAEAALAPYADAATAVLDPNSGDVWALASVPAFNPNSLTIGTTLGGIPLNPAVFGQILNKAVLGAYPAGSSFKPFTLAAGLQSGVVTPTSVVTCPPTWSYNEGFTAHNYEDHTLPGGVSLAEAMAFSCNTTYMPLGLAIYEADPAAFTDLLAEFGFGQPTGIGFLVEETGILPDEAWLQANREASFGSFDQVQLSIGQGLFLGTPLQLTNAYAAIGNGGTLWTPRIVTQATLPDGTIAAEVESVPLRQVSVSPAHLDYVVETLKAVVNLPYGTATAAFAGFGLQVAGKSGTAETGSPDPNAWFPAFAPADAPSIAVATVLVQVPLATGGSDAAPLVRQVMAVHFAN